MTSTLPSAQLLSGLKQALHTPSPELKIIKRVWPKVTQLVKAEYQSLSRRIPDDDPIYEKCDLLSPLRSEFDEVLHTLALAYLLDPCKPHGLGRWPLRQVLLSLQGLPQTHKPTVTAIFRILKEPGSRLVVIPELSHSIGESRKRMVSRTDVWLQVESPRLKRLIVIENKVGSRESDRQLYKYEQAAKSWCRNNAKGASPLLVFLTPEGQEPESGTLEAWACLSYSQLANALRKTWRSRQSAPGATWLKLYIATLVRQVLDVRVDRVGFGELSNLRMYLGDSAR